jgi:hypothetical protein
MDLNYDAVVTVSGDGLIHEVMNGFASHKNPIRVFAIPIAPIPTGSGNGLSLNLLGAEVYIHNEFILWIGHSNLWMLARLRRRRGSAQCDQRLAFELGHCVRFSSSAFLQDGP